MAASTDGSCGGYDYKFVDGDPPSKYICHICTLVARDPQQVTCCANIYCLTCLQQLKEKGQDFNCPTCREPLTDRYFKDGRADREIKSLSVYCTNNSCCQWKGSLKEIDTHLQRECPYQLVACTNDCGEKLQRRSLQNHLTEKCPKRLVKCQYCREEGTHQLIAASSHLEVCPDYAIQCTNEGCEEMIARHLMLSHKESCPKGIISCEYSTVGCSKRMRREDQEEHNEQSMKEHLRLAVERINVMKENEISREVMEKSIGEIKDSMEEKIQQLQATTNKHSSYRSIKMYQFLQKKEDSDEWHSPGFYTSPGGYKMSLCVNANGHGTGKGSHISCFIYFMPGEYDDTLEWPFQGEVTIELLNQLQDDNHKKYAIYYNETTPEECKQRVHKGRSEHGLGFGQFIPHAKLDFQLSTNCQYLKDDTLYFRVSVKVTSNIKPWLV